MKKLPIGISNFPEIIAEGYFKAERNLVGFEWEPGA